MHAIDGYFSDELIKCDTSHQVQALTYACEAREDEPLVITEVASLLSTMRLISSYLCADQNPEYLIPPSESLVSVFGSGTFEQDIFSFELELPNQFEPWLLLDPLTALLESLLGDGVFYNSEEHLCSMPLFGDLLSQIARIYLLDLPHLIVKTNKLPLAERRNYVLICVSSCLSLFSLLTRSSKELLTHRNPPDEYKSEFTIYKAVPLEDVVTAFLDSCCDILHDFTLQIDRYAGFGPEFLQFCHVQTLYFIDRLTAKATELKVEINPAEIRGLVDYTICEVSGDICQRRQILALTILQRIELTQDSCNEQLLARTLSEALFHNGYLNVKSKEIAESQLAILSIIERVSRKLGQFVIYLCQDLDFAIQDNFVFDKFQKQEETLPGDEPSSSDGEFDVKDVPNESASSNKKESTKIPTNPDDPFRSRSPSPGLRILESDESADADAVLGTDTQMVAFKIFKPAFTPANFVVHFLLQIIQQYGDGLFHSSRRLELHLVELEENDSAIHRNVPDGHKVNYKALNALTLKQVEQVEADYEQKLRELHAQDEIALAKIQKSSKYENITKARLFSAEEQFELRDRELRKAFLLSKAKIGREAFGTTFANDASYRATLTTRKFQKTATQLKQEVDCQFELLYIRFCLQITANVCTLSRNSPSRQVKLALQQIDAKFVSGLLSFVEMPRSTAPALQVIHAILSFPNIDMRIYDILIENGLFESLCGVNQAGAAHAAVFVCRLLGDSPGLQLSSEQIAELAEQTLDSFLALFCDFQDRNLSQCADQALRAVTYILIEYSQKVGPVYSIINNETFERFIQEILKILQPRQHHFEYFAVIALYGIFGLTRRQNVSRVCYDTGVFKAIVALCERKFAGEFKLEPVDLVIIRLLTDIIENADEKIERFAQTESNLQELFCKAYRLWEGSLNMRSNDDKSKAVLPGSELHQPAAVTPRGNVFEVENYGGEAAARTSSRALQSSRLSPSRQRVNLIDAQSKIRNYEEDSVIFPEQVIKEGEELAQFMNLSQDARYLLHCNFTATFLAFFRALYPGITSHFSIINSQAADKSKLPSTGRLSVHRPSSGMTPKIGMKIPIMLPNLAISSKTDDGNTVDVYISPLGCLTILQAEAQSLKESLLILQTGISDDFIASDRNFIQNAIDVLTDRIEIIRRSGLALEASLAKEEVASEAQFMALMD